MCKIGNKSVLWLAALGLLSASLASGAERYSARIFSDSQAVAAVTVGDFDPTHAGHELACLMADGSIVELALDASGWTASTIFLYRGNALPWRDPRSRVDLRVGDLLPEYAGDEILLNLRRQIFAVYYAPSGGWTNQIIADGMGNVWSAEVGDCDPAHEGSEVFSIIEGVALDWSVGIVHVRSGSNYTWEQNHVYSGHVGMDAAIGDSNPDFPGDEIIVVTEGWPAYEIVPPTAGGPGPWPQRLIWNGGEEAGWVVEIADVDPESQGNEIVFGTRYTDRIIMSRHNGTNLHNLEILLTGVNTNRDYLNNMFNVAVGQVVPTSPAAEILGVDNSGSVYLVQKVAGQWLGSVLWQDTNALYAVATADLIPAPGDEVVVAGASGVVTLLLNPAPVLTVALTPERQAILSWQGVAGLSYAIETTTNFMSSSSWSHLANLTYQRGFHGSLSYTNLPTHAAPERFFRVRASW